MASKRKDTYVLEEVEMDASDDDDIEFAEVDVPFDEDGNEADDSGFLEAPDSSSRQDEEDFESLVKSLQSASIGNGASGGKAAAGLGSTGHLAPPKGQISKRPEVVDDFIRNFLIKAGMMRTLETFQTEWYDAIASGKLDANRIQSVPDVYLMNQTLEERIQSMERELQHAKEVATKAKSTWDKFRKERDFHRMHHRRVVQEKNKLVKDLQRLQKHYENYEPTLNEMKRKYELAMKEKMLTKIERDKIAARAGALEASIAATGTNAGLAAGQTGTVAGTTLGSRTSTQTGSKGVRSTSTGPGATNKKKTLAGATGTASGSGSSNAKSPVQTSVSFASALPGATASGATLPSDSRANPYWELDFDPTPAERFSLRNSRTGAHSMSIANVALHPRKPVLATVSDDTTWKLWSLPSGELIMSGEGHRDWVAGCDFHPRGTHLATASGDSTVKIWDFASASCVATLTEHSQAVWSCAFHDLGDFLVSSSLDHTAKVWDITTGRSRMTLRGHLDSVNHVTFQPFSNLVCTASGDKTVSVWDCRSGLCIQTFYGHQNAVNHVAFSLRGDTISSCDSDGVVKLWDARMVAERSQIVAGPYPANKSVFDRSGAVLAIASDDGKVKIADAVQGSIMNELTGHDDAVQAVAFDREGGFLVSAGADCSFRYWSA